ncbi:MULTISPECIES: hypothetical protein [Methylobacterium]|uniref:hypothetical protein n=1 Tax=Methylobacterium TaxID=407 RepID=UPI0015879454|nr:hypothetical protein [Methylobacterium sp. UNC378MF]
MLDIHWHLVRRTWSIREAGRVVGYVSALALRDVRFVVSAAGVARIRRRGQREVVAYARGALTESRPVTDSAQRVHFNPYVAAAFLLPDGTPIAAAAFVAFLSDGSCRAVPIPSEGPPCVSWPPSPC